MAFRARLVVFSALSAFSSLSDSFAGPELRSTPIGFAVSITKPGESSKKSDHKEPAEPVRLETLTLSPFSKPSQEKPLPLMDPKQSQKKRAATPDEYEDVPLPRNLRHISVSKTLDPDNSAELREAILEAEGVLKCFNDRLAVLSSRKRARFV